MLPFAGCHIGGQERLITFRETEQVHVSDRNAMTVGVVTSLVQAVAAHLEAYDRLPVGAPMRAYHGDRALHYWTLYCEHGRGEVLP